MNLRLISFFITLSFYSHAQSVLSQGRWYKIGVTESGVHKIDANFLKKAGLNISNLNPKNLRIFGNGGAMLPQKNADNRPKDLQENALFISGEADNRFDDGDYLLFYGESSHKILAKNGVLSHEINVYSDTTFYFLNLGDVAGLRIKNQTNTPNSSLTSTITTFDDYQFIEKENINLVHSGRNWWGDLITDSQNIDFKTTGIIANSSFLLHISALGVAQTNTHFSVKINDKMLGSLPFGSVGSGRYDIKGWQNTDTFLGSNDGNANQKINIQLNKNGQNNAFSYLDFVALQCQRKLQAEETQTIFRSFASTKNSISNYQIDGITNINQIWDITNPQIIQNQVLKNGLFVAESKDLKTFVLFSDKNTLVPKNIRQIENQNLHSTETPDLLIIAAPDFLKQAQKLADFRKKNDDLSVSVFTTNQVFNEYSSGSLDPTAIRDFVRNLYRKNPKKLKYLLLFGDGTYDYKNNSKNPDFSANKYVPVYESSESLHPIYSFSSDDYFGFLEDSEGEWKENNTGDHSMEIGIGRLPAKTQAEAETLVNKLILYANQKKTLGQWRNKISFVADDGDYNIHQNDAISLANVAEKTNAHLSTNKILLDAFPAVASANGQTLPKANIAIQEAIEKGSLLINYNGHGDESGWTEEKILTTSNILSWKGINNLPVFLTATCQFGRYDDPNLVSGAELGVLSSKGFAIAMLTTTRPVFANTNYLLNNAFYQSLDKLGEKRLGDIFRETKNKSLAGVLNRNFVLLGDPSMKLAFPQEQIQLKAQNDTLKALAKVSFEGQILKNNQVDINFQGLVSIKVYDKAQERETLGGKSSKIKYQVFQNKLFEGHASVKNGRFTFNFVVPKDINYQIGKGQIEMYAISADSLVDAVGVDKSILVGGSAKQSEDTTPPKISFFVNNKLLQDGGKINKSDFLNIEISDDNGINTAGLGLGHDVLLIINDTLKISLNQQFVYQPNSYQKGSILYLLQNLPIGTHQFKVLAYDIYNNLREESLKLELYAEQARISVSVTAYPNPFQENIKFEINTDETDERVEIFAQIFDSFGRLIKTYEDIPLIFGNELVWKTNNDYPTGIYIYVVQLMKDKTVISNTISGKIYCLH